MPFPPRLVFPLTRICGSGPPVRLSALAGLPLHPFWCHEWGQSDSARDALVWVSPRREKRHLVLDAPVSQTHRAGGGSAEPGAVAALRARGV